MFMKKAESFEPRLLIAALDKYSSGTGYHFTCKNFDPLRGPAVYMISKSDHVLYIGLSRNGIGRIAFRHKQADAALADYDDVQIWPCRSFDCARLLEATLIYLFKPKYNRRLTIHPVRGLNRKMRTLSALGAP